MGSSLAKNKQDLHVANGISIVSLVALDPIDPRVLLKTPYNCSRVKRTHVLRPHFRQLCRQIVRMHIYLIGTTFY